VSHKVKTQYRVVILLLCLLALPLNCIVNASIRHVPAEFATIQEAVNAATSGDTVLIANGTYSGQGNIDVLVTNIEIVIRSESGPYYTIIDAEKQSRAFTFAEGLGQNTVLEGITVRNCCQDLRGGILLNEGSKIRIEDCIIENCSNCGGQLEGGGIRLWMAQAEIINTIIRNCDAPQGGGIAMGNSSELILTDSEITNCTGSALFFNDHCTVTMTDVLIQENNGSESSHTAGVACMGKSNLAMNRCNLLDNEDSFGNCGGLRVEDSTATVTNCVISRNYSSGHAGAILFRNNGLGEVFFTTISDNDADNENAVYIHQSSPEFKNCIAWNPEVDTEFFSGSGAAHTVLYCDVRNGSGGLGNFDLDPLFTRDGTYHLTGDSPCIDAGVSAGVSDDMDQEARPNGFNFDVGADEYHAPVDLTVELDMPSQYYQAGDPFYLDMNLINNGDILNNIPTFCILDVYGEYFFWPGWDAFGYESTDIPAKDTESIVILPEFFWPGQVGSANNIIFYGACTDQSISKLLGTMDMISFGWGS